MMGDAMGIFRERRQRLVRWWLTLLTLGFAMVVGSFLGEVLPLPFAGPAWADEVAGTPDGEGAPPDAADAIDAETLAALESRLDSLPDRGSAGAGRNVLVFPVQGNIDLGLSAFLERALKTAEAPDLVILDINTFGGRVDAAVQIRDRMMELDTPSVAYVHPRAISAGALIALSCDAIAIAPGGTIGAATPVQIEGGEATPVDEKYTSYLRSEFRSTAEARGRDGEVAEAMVDASTAIEGLVVEEKLLTMDDGQALEWGIADVRIDDLDALLTALRLGQAELERPEISWAERMVRFLTDPIVGGLLMTVGMLGIGIELYTPGVGLPGGVGVTCLALFFFGHFMTHLAGIEEIVLIGIGLILLLVEAFVIPGFGVAGIAGIIVLGLGMVLALLGLDVKVAFETGAIFDAALRVFASLSVALMAFLGFLYFAPESRFASRLVLKEKVKGTVEREGRTSSQAEEDELMGQGGVAVSDLRPSGIARFGEQRVDVVTEGDYVDGGSRVRVIEVRGNRVVVRRIEEE